MIGPQTDLLTSQLQPCWLYSLFEHVNSCLKYFCRFSWCPYCSHLWKSLRLLFMPYFKATMGTVNKLLLLLWQLLLHFSSLGIHSECKYENPPHLLHLKMLNNKLCWELKLYCLFNSKGIKQMSNGIFWLLQIVETRLIFLLIDFSWKMCGTYTLET